MKLFDWLLLCVPISLFALGFMSNELVMWANHNSMPVFMPNGVCPADMGPIWHCMTSQDHLKFLADIFARGPAGIQGIFSVGDLGIWGGEDSIWYCWFALVSRLAGRAARAY